MEHFVAYQNSDELGRFNNGRSIPEGRSGRWFTAKRFREETIVGNRLWAIEGGGSPKRYRLVSSGIVTHLTPRKRPAPYRGMGLDVHFRVDAHLQSSDVTDRSWFTKLRKEQRSFSHGLNKIKDQRAITGLRALLGRGLPNAGGGIRGAGKADQDPMPGRKPFAISTIRRSSSAASEIIRQLIPEKHLPAVLKAVAHSVQIAHHEAPSKWGLRLNRKGVMLKVGFVEVLQVQKGWFHQLVKSSRVSRKAVTKNHLSFDDNAPYQNAPGCGCCDMDDLAVVARAYPALLPAHEEAIRIAARGQRHTSTTRDHSPGLIVFLSQELGARLPQPAYLEILDATAGIPEEIPAGQEFEEGAAVQVLVNRYERDPAARDRCIEHHGTNCVACGASLAERYGPEVNGLIHVHHLKPLASIGTRTIVDPVRDLRPVCPNCHAVIHLTTPPRTIEQVKKMLCKQDGGGQSRSSRFR